MTKIQIGVIILCLFIYSCKSESTKYTKFQFREYNMKIKVPMHFKSASEKEIKALYEYGSEKIKENGYKSDLNQSTLLFLNKGEFSSIKIKYYPISNEVVKDYKNQWKNLKKMTFDILTKEKMAEATIDSASRIEKINGIDFYVFETNINLLDLNNNKANFKSLKYSTPLDKLDFVIDISYANQMDEEDILETIESLTINKIETTANSFLAKFGF